MGIDLHQLIEFRVDLDKYVHLFVAIAANLANDVQRTQSFPINDLLVQIDAHGDSRWLKCGSAALLSSHSVKRLHSAVVFYSVPSEKQDTCSLCQVYTRTAVTDCACLSHTSRQHRSSRAAAGQQYFAVIIR
ncbi:unnamed protein product [Trichogramma brassicae]|uniref:Uncharacterized protein n=1 Tax=Trichogramma brassicae TaxID=86971 RepID=A0A6H5IPV9_9HYME|nr:unnamed protein product [Trichogramma brassicae]